MTDVLREFETRLLLAIRDLDDGAYGLTLHERIESVTGRSVSLGQIYTALARLEQRGLVTSEEGRSSAGRGGRRRKYYRLTPAALHELRATAATFRELADAIAGSLPDAAEGRS